MKKTACILLFLLVAFCCAGCGGQEITDQWLIQKSLEAAARLSDLADWKYLKLLNMQWSDTTAAALKNKPAKAQIIFLPEDAEERLWDAALSENGSDWAYRDIFPEDAPEVIRSRRRMLSSQIPATIINMAANNAMSGNTDRPTTPQVVDGAMTVGQAFTLYNLCIDAWQCEGPALKGTWGVYLEYDEQTAALVLFQEADASHVNIQASVIPSFDPEQLIAAAADSLPELKSLVTVQATYMAKDLQSMGF